MKLRTGSWGAALLLAAAGAAGQPAPEPIVDPAELSAEPAPSGSRLKAAGLKIGAVNETLDPLKVDVEVLWVPYDLAAKRLDPARAGKDSTSFQIRGTYGRRVWRTRRNAPGSGVHLVAQVRLISEEANGARREYKSSVYLAEGIEPLFWINYAGGALALELALGGGKTAPFPDGHLAVCSSSSVCRIKPSKR